MAQAGVGLSGRYVSEAAWNPTGGQRHDVTEAGQVDLGLHLDLGRIAHTDGTFQATITSRRGHQLDRRAGLGTLQEVQEIYGRGQTWRLTQFWYEQRLLSGTVDLRAGRTSPGEDFAAFSCSFQNLSFCGSQPGNVAGAYWYNWPISQWGARLRVSSTRAYVQIAVFEENPRNLEKGFSLGHFGGATGALIPAEVGVTTGRKEGGPVGSYKVGAWLSTSDKPDLYYDRDRQPQVLTRQPALLHRAGYGFWINAQQQLTGRSAAGESVSGLTVFLNATITDRRTSLIDNQVAVGVFEKRILPWFTDDVLGFGVVRTHVAGRVGRLERLKGKEKQSAEYGAELYYGFHPFGWLEVRPNLQWIHHAGGFRSAREVGVIGLKSAVRL
ncbi:carbohydrate porin [Sphingomonas quercus]|uniref:carbohydrate porin n=1 Tax=Sphingomonas quercus TaxID=2842451 RepID=UPI00209BB2F8|nr:carbohydrate porin [Sphingomonas quercus]